MSISKRIIVLATAKIHILKQFTTFLNRLTVFRLLCLLLQRYTFWSNSQLAFMSISKRIIVLATAKIHILKQFTTFLNRLTVFRLLCLLLQRYTFWSNSQLAFMSISKRINCACYCKDTHFEAIHNSHSWVYQSALIVLATAKIHILKQFTTFIDLWLCRSSLCLLLQRYTFWSNSQPAQQAAAQQADCACYCKDTHFEAIHNH